MDYMADGREVRPAKRVTSNKLFTPNNVGTEPRFQQILNDWSYAIRITLKSSASIYALAFAEAGSSFGDFKSYNPFALSRSA
jgi:outer membrane protein insertion porin family